MKKLFVLLFVAQFIAFSATAKPRTNSEIVALAKQALLGLSRQGNMAPQQGELKELYKSAGITVMGYENEGFAIIANDDVIEEVLGVSDSHFTGTANQNFQWWLNAIEEVCTKSVAQNKAPRKVTKPDTSRFPERVDALTSSLWGQEAPYWNMCPMGSYARCLTGCVATAIAQVFYTNKYPTTGVGSRTIYYNSTPVTANFGDAVYEYDKMIDDYSGSYTQEQADAVALLMKDCGVAVNMDYGPDGSGAYSDQAAEGLRKYFGIETARLVERDNYTEPEWMEMVYTELAGGHSMYYSAVDSNPWTGGGHAFVCDGYDENGRVHINWGWCGSDNGFYNIALLNPSGYQFSQYQDMILGMYDPDAATDPSIELIELTINSEEAGNMKELIGQENLAAVKKITVTGVVNNDDIALLKRLAEGTELTEFDIEAKGHLATIDLSNATVEADEIADNAFKDAAILRTINLPRVLTRIGNNAFSGCKRLSKITSYTYSVPKMGTRVFEDVSSSGMSINVIAGSSEYYRRNAQWKTIITENNVTEFGTCLKARNTTKEYGEENPVFGYQTVGERVVGTPHLWTDATVDSEPGKYTIYIEAGDIEDTTDIVFVNGTLTIKEVPVTGINGVNADGNSNRTYNINGVRFTDNSQRGLYINNGKKVVR